MKTTRRIKCDDCNEVAMYSFDTQREAIEWAKRTRSWKCTRHSSPERLLTLDNKNTERVFTATKSEKVAGLYWHDGVRLGSGFTFGDCYKAFAKDFPEGTKLRVTAEIILPE